MIQPDVLRTAAERGTAVHDACASYALGLPVIGLRDDAGPYVESFKRWFDRVVKNVILCEERLTDNNHGYHGEPDLLIEAKHGELILLDLKTPVSKMKTWRLQLAAYKNLCEIFTALEIDLVGSLRLSPEGKTPKMDYYDYQAQDFNIFLSCLNAYRFFYS